jgi:hypothetical protein
VIPEPENPKAITLEIGGPLGISLRNFIQGVLSSIELDHDVVLQACKIHDIGSECDLPPKMRARERECPAQMPPEFALGLRGAVAQRAGAVSAGVDALASLIFWIHVEDHPHPLPLPSRGRGESDVAPLYSAASARPLNRNVLPER